MINYSIIIPHKNSAECLEYCLSTIPVRDDVQVIVVDDNSAPDKVDFDHFPQWQGRNYECFFTKEGKGAGYARNVGLDHAQGKWVLFVDTDDYLLPTINDIFDECVDSAADLIYFRPKAVMLEDRQTPSNRADWYNNLIDEYFETANENNIRTRFHVPWSKMVRKSLIDTYSVRFDEIPYSNDVVFSVLVGCKAAKIEVKEKSYYVVTQSTNSLTSSFLSKPRELEIRTKAFFDAEKIIFEHNRCIDENNVIAYLRILFGNSKDLFFSYFNLMQSFGYSRLKLINKLFRENSWKSRFKRSIYVYCKTIINRIKTLK